MTAPLFVRDRYQILQTLSQSRWKATYLAEDRTAPEQRQCVIQTFKCDTEDRKILERVKQQVDQAIPLLIKLNNDHPFLPQIYAYFSNAGEFSLVREWIDGISLETVLTQGALDETRVQCLLQELLSTLSYLHHNRVIHRDLKPSNIILRSADAKPVLLNFAFLEEMMRTSTDVKKGFTGSVTVETSGYRPPEQQMGKPRPSSNLYSLGLIAIGLLTGKPPQSLTEDAETGDILWHQAVPDINPNLVKVLDRAIAYHVRDRYQTAEEMLHDLEQVDTSIQSTGDTDEIASRDLRPNSLPEHFVIGSDVITNLTGSGGIVYDDILNETSVRGLEDGSSDYSDSGLSPSSDLPPRPSPTSYKSDSSTTSIGKTAEYSRVLLPSESLTARVMQRLQGFVRAFIGFWKKSDPVDCTVFAPATVSPGVTFAVQVFAHRPEQRDLAKAIATEIAPGSTQRGFKSLEINVKRGSRLTLCLHIPGLEVDNPIEYLIWNGRATSVLFGVTVSQDASLGNYIGTVIVSHNQIPIGHIKCIFEVVPGTTQSQIAQPLGDAARRYQKAFISYASKDRTEVLKRVQMLSRMKIDFFQDVLNLEPGDRWEKELYRQIDSSDLFLLFWSTSAKESRWVMKEVEYAINRKRGNDLASPEIIPVIIEGPPPVAPPPELAHLHFNDRLIYFMNE